MDDRLMGEGGQSSGWQSALAVERKRRHSRVNQCQTSRISVFRSMEGRVVRGEGLVLTPEWRACLMFI